MFWFLQGSNNYEGDFGLVYDVCSIILPGSLSNSAAVETARDDNDGTCSPAIDGNCINALDGLAVDTANLLITSPTPGPNSNLTNGSLPTVCADNANAIKEDLPKSCRSSLNLQVVEHIRTSIMMLCWHKISVYHIDVAYKCMSGY